MGTRRKKIALISTAESMTAVDGTGLTTGDLPSPPFLSVPGLPNFRDAGGYEVISDSPSISSGEGRRKVKIVRRGILFRSSEVGITIVSDTLSSMFVEEPLADWMLLSIAVYPSGCWLYSAFSFLITYHSLDIVVGMR